MGENTKDDKVNEPLDGDLELDKSDTDDVVGGFVPNGAKKGPLP